MFSNSNFFNKLINVSPAVQLFVDALYYIIGSQSHVLNKDVVLLT